MPTYTVCLAVLLLAVCGYGLRSIYLGPLPQDYERGTRAAHSVLLFYAGLAGLLILAFRFC